MTLSRNALTIHPNKQPGEQTWRVKMQLTEVIRKLMLKISTLTSATTEATNTPGAHPRDITWVNHDKRISGQTLRKIYMPHASVHRFKLDYKQYQKILHDNAKTRLGEKDRDKQLIWSSYRQLYHVIQPLVGLHVHAEINYSLHRAASFDKEASKLIPYSTVPVLVTTRLLHRFGAPIQIDHTYKDTCRLTVATMVSGRMEQLERFAHNLAKLAGQCQLHLAIAVFDDDLELVHSSLKGWLTDKVSLTVAKPSGRFARSLGLNAAMKTITDNTATLISDIDMMFDVDFIRRCQRYVLPRHRIYFPIVLSEFDSRHESTYSGYWRDFGYGMLCIHPSDYHNIGGMSESFQEWGDEDTDFVSRASKIGYEVFRYVILLNKTFIHY